MKKAICTLAVLTALTSAQAFAHKEGDFIIRAGLASVVPNDDSGAVLNDSNLGLEVDSNTQFAFTIGYMITDNISFEVLGATPFSHDINLTAGGVDQGKLGDTKHLPPTFMLQYYFGTSESQFRPYVGAGLNYTMFFDEGLVSGAPVSDLELDDSFGLAANIGADYMINDSWFVNGSVWYADIDTDASYKAGGQTYTTKVEIDPWVFMISGGYKF
ncbi:outer membrane protein OmpW [Vibrio sp. 404]|uniref:Outer membrane protein W n=1 Tax=Vibrio marinisediminis TaxID=2758441 RepID=A0A7W2ISX9_9VIBR|nr:outer membrane protein OmpW [Vibrio marinisediminis]MBA5761875.1 outer membrane protein OmpW [Vibrio marinisediminis]